MEIHIDDSRYGSGNVHKAHERDEATTSTSRTETINRFFPEMFDWKFESSNKGAQRAGKDRYGLIPRQYCTYKRETLLCVAQYDLSVYLVPRESLLHANQKIGKMHNP